VDKGEDAPDYSIPENPDDNGILPVPPSRPNTNIIYAILLMFAVTGFVGIKMLESMVKKQDLSIPEADSTARLEEMILGTGWLAAAGIFMLAAGAVVLTVYIGLRFGRIKPVRQEPQNKVTWGIGALVKGLIVAFFLLVTFSIAGPIIIMPFGLSETATIMIIDSATKIMIVLWIVFMLKFEYGASPADAGLKIKHPLKDTGYAFLSYLAVLPVFAAAAFAWEWVGKSLGLEYKPSPVIGWLLESKSMLTVVLVSVSAVIIAPIVEEFFFRCFTYPALKRQFGIAPSIVLSSAYFSLIHFDFFSFLPIMVLGVALAFLYERRQSIVGPAALHFFNNARVVFLVLYLRYYAN